MIGLLALPTLVSQCLWEVCLIYDTCESVPFGDVIDLTDLRRRCSSRTPFRPSVCFGLALSYSLCLCTKRRGRLTTMTLRPNQVSSETKSELSVLLCLCLLAESFAFSVPLCRLQDA